MPRFPYVAEVPNTHNTSWVSIAEGIMRASDAETAEKKVRKKFPKARHIEIMEAVPAYEDGFPPWDYWKPYVGVCLCILVGLLVLGAVIAMTGRGISPDKSEKEERRQQRQQQESQPPPPPVEVDEYPTANSYDTLLDDR
jgi:hypothetical protein